jgi:hypothetical protein
MSSRYAVLAERLEIALATKALIAGEGLTDAPFTSRAGS